jgi:hypothetical protein
MHATTASSFIVPHAYDRRGSLHRGVCSPWPSSVWQRCTRPHPALLHTPCPLRCSCRPPPPAPASPSLLLHLLCAALPLLRTPASLHLSLLHRPSCCSCFARPTLLDDADSCCQCKEKHRALARKPSGLASCYGYSVPMRTVEDATPGYDAYCKHIFQLFQMF